MNKSKQHIKFINVPELSISYHRNKLKPIDHKVTSSESAADFFRSLFPDGEIELRESFYVLFLNRGNIPIGYYQLSVGGIHATVADVRIILGIALKALAVGIIVAHNHPSSETKASQADIRLTKKLKETAAMFDIAVLDSLIITKENYSSLVDDDLMDAETPYPLKAFRASKIDNKTNEFLELEAQALQLELELLILK